MRGAIRSALFASGDVKACRQSGQNDIIAGAHGSPEPAAGPTLSPEAAVYRAGFAHGQRVQQAKWTAPATTRLLLEAGVGTYHSRWGGSPMPGANTTNLIRAVERCLGGQTAPGTPAHMAFRT